MPHTHRAILEKEAVPEIRHAFGVCCVPLHWTGRNPLARHSTLADKQLQFESQIMSAAVGYTCVSRRTRAKEPHQIMSAPREAARKVVCIDLRRICSVSQISLLLSGIEATTASSSALTTVS